jgi:hypothetical protein
VRLPNHFLFSLQSPPKPYPIPDASQVANPAALHQLEQGTPARSYAGRNLVPRSHARASQEPRPQEPCREEWPTLRHQESSGLIIGAAWADPLASPGVAPVRQVVHLGPSRLSHVHCRGETISYTFNLKKFWIFGLGSY